MKKIYNKLVRDKILEIIERDGKTYESFAIFGDKLTLALKNKLAEETKEYETAKNNIAAKEELADILEVIEALAKQHGSSFEEICLIKEIKKEHRGGFEKGIVLVSVDE